MNYLSNGVREKLQSAFLESSHVINVRDDCLVVLGSQNQTVGRIQSIIESIGFCPLIAQSKVNGNFAFTIMPYKIPIYFYKEFPSSLLNTIATPISEFTDKTNDYIEDLYQRFNVDEIIDILKDKTFLSKSTNKPEDKMASINCCRALVTSSLNAGLHDILSSKVKGNHPIVEIGSRIGYSLSDVLSVKTIRTQWSSRECQLLQHSSPDTIYQLNINKLCNRLIKYGKTVPLFFGLNIFDEMHPEKRKACLLKLSKLQSPGDHIMMLLDTNPFLESMIEQLHSLYPKNAMLPYIEMKNNCPKLCIVLLPYIFHYNKDLLQMILVELGTARKGGISDLQKILQQQIQSYPNNFKIIDLETFFIEQIKRELNETGYDVRVYYHTTFTTGKLFQDNLHITENLIYKSVSDIVTVRQWALNDVKFLNQLTEKGIALPNTFNESFLKKIQQKGEKILGAEFLVIEATKREASRLFSIFADKKIELTDDIIDKLMTFCMLLDLRNLSLVNRHGNTLAQNAIIPLAQKYGYIEKKDQPYTLQGAKKYLEHLFSELDLSNEQNLNISITRKYSEKSKKLLCIESTLQNLLTLPTAELFKLFAQDSFYKDSFHRLRAFFTRELNLPISKNLTESEMQLGTQALIYATANVASFMFTDKDANMKIVKLLLKHKADPNLIVAGFSNPLFFAAQKGLEEFIELFLKNEADVNKLSPGGASSLAFACGHSYDYGDYRFKPNLKAINLLLKAGADPNLGTPSPLHCIIAHKVTNFILPLVQAGANIDQTDVAQKTFLHLALESENELLVNSLLEAGADAKIAHPSGVPLLHLAITNKLWGTIPNFVNKQIYIDETNAEGKTPLYRMVELAIQGDAPKSLVELLVKKGADVNIIYNETSLLELIEDMLGIKSEY